MIVHQIYIYIFYLGTEYIADADAKTWETLQSLPWKITKIDCINHTMRNIRIKLEDVRKTYKIKNY